MNQTFADVIIITALSEEYNAVITHLNKEREEVVHKGTIYEVGKFASDHKNCKVAVVQIGMGNPNAAMETERAIEYFKPSYVFFAGVAGGIKDVELGDVVAANKVYGYEFGKVEDKGFKTRPEIGQSTHAMIQRAYSVARHQNWHQRIKDKDDYTPKPLVKPIAAGEKVVTSVRTEIYQGIREHYNDAVAVEMEGIGFLTAIHANLGIQGIEAIVIRGISDKLAGKSPEADEQWQPRASHHAAAFAFQVLAEIKLKTDTNTKHNSSEATANDWYKRLLKLVSGLYPKGPEDRQIWSRAGGDIAKLDLGSTGDTNWYKALRDLKLGGGGNSITPSSLVQTMREDYENNLLLKQLIDELYSAPS